MSFGTNLYTLRKSKSMSQEDLARELNTSRQAVSKWENGQGFPEMEKLLMMSNIFAVSIDYLLKGDNAIQDSDHGFYASREYIEGFLIFQHSVIKQILTGISLLIMSGAPYLLFQDTSVFSIIMAFFLAAAGLFAIITGCLKENKYKKITREPLIIDGNYLLELHNRYIILKKKYVFMLAVGFGLCLASLGLATLLEDYLQLSVSSYYVLPLFLFTAGATLIIFPCVMLWTFDILIHNDEYINNKNSRKPVSFRQIIGIIILAAGVLVFIFIVTGGEGRIATLIERILAKL